MNDIVNKLLLAEINLCLKCILDNLGLPILLVDHLQKITKECKSLKKLEIQDGDFKEILWRF